MEGKDDARCRLTYIRVKLISGSVKTKDQGTIVARFGDNLVVPLTFREG